MAVDFRGHPMFPSTGFNAPTRFDRRRFLGSIVVTAGGAAVTALVPVSLLEVREACAVVAPGGYADPCGDWTVDDMCNAYPPYAFDIRRAVAPHVPAAAPVADADRQWVT